MRLRVIIYNFHITLYYKKQRNNSIDVANDIKRHNMNWHGSIEYIYIYIYTLQFEVYIAIFKTQHLQLRPGMHLFSLTRFYLLHFSMQQYEANLRLCAVMHFTMAFKIRRKWQASFSMYRAVATALFVPTWIAVTQIACGISARDLAYMLTRRYIIHSENTFIPLE